MNVGWGERRRTVLLIDADPHARAALRNALEAAGFSVGEAVDRREGARTAARVCFDAVLADLPMEQIEPLGQGGADDTPFYLLSTAGDALVGGVGLQELGISGFFLKPVDAAVVVQTLRMRLAVDPSGQAGG
ncbi:hypothetical protein OOT46_25210 [Aquabacterium sp. A7-Y]|uniref:response regulator n=1 Tax=Aquabacterium sp. A7-Y TaxID=1349605 RepID=UPI00223E1B36|nr:response regulator [Aquabacterium sp. A7-Y]MCW7541118.1 hypothetical protein [Aquabacterium sp. A7-Y]